MATAQKYFTYQPKPVAAAPLGKGSLANQPMTAANTLQLKPGQIAKFKAGEGWYAEDPKPLPVPKPTAGPGVTTPQNPGWGQNPAYAATPPVAAPSASAPSGGGTAPAPAAPYDMENAINTDWETIQANTDANKLTGDAATAFQKQLRQAYIDYGGAGEDLGDWAQYIDAPTIEAARNNKFSTMALDRRNFEQSSAQAQAEMAARGGLSSGDTVTALKNLLFNKEASDYGGLRTFQGGAVSGFDNLGRIKQQALDIIRGARGNAAGRAAANAPTVDTSTWQGGETGAGVGSGADVSAGSVGAPPAVKPPAAAKYTWDETVSNLSQLNAWLKARGKTLAAFKASNPAAYAKLAAQ